MRLPNREYAVIEPEKLTGYLLNTNHRRGDDNARLLIQFGYSIDNWKQLETDVRNYHLNFPRLITLIPE
ncbi:hypothetical protein H6F95_10890 [Cyanobacteria bacterium FACHB-471]|nr:hypothetical protein [Cyanobacteria bacterium FACHB-471]